jgi:hypothetical protein
MLPLLRQTAFAWLLFFCLVCHMNVSAFEYVQNYKCQHSWEVAVNHAPKRDVNNSEFRNRILLVHVGKSCGTSVAAFFQRNNVSYYEVHMFPLSDYILNEFTHVVIAVRDPINRTISAFNYGDPRQAFPGYKFKSGEHILYKCFNSVDEYANSLLANKTECEQLAESGRESGHIAQNICFHIGGMMQHLLAKRPHVYIVDSETCEADVAWVLESIGVPLKKQKFPHVRNAAKTTESTFLSPSGKENLKIFLEDLGEYNIYRFLRNEFSSSTKP